MQTAKIMFWHAIENDFNFVAETEATVDPEGVAHLIFDTATLRTLAALLVENIPTLPIPLADNLAIEEGVVAPPVKPAAARKRRKKTDDGPTDATDIS